MENRELNLEDLEKASGGNTGSASAAARETQIAEVRRRLISRKNNSSDRTSPELNLRMELDYNSQSQKTVLTTEDIIWIWRQVYGQDAPVI